MRSNQSTLLVEASLLSLELMHLSASGIGGLLFTRACMAMTMDQHDMISCNPNYSSPASKRYRLGEVARST